MKENFRCEKNEVMNTREGTNEKAEKMNKNNV